MILEAILTVGEIRKPGYVMKVMRQLEAQAETPVRELHPATSVEEEAKERQAAVAWLRGAIVRARARASEKHAKKR